MQELINNKIKELTENGELDKIITKEATTFLQNTVNKTLASYGDVTKKFEEKLKVAVMDGIERLDFISYAQTISDMVQSELNKSVVEFGIAPAREMLKSFTGELEKKEWKLSEIIAKFITMEVEKDGEQDSGEISLLVEKSDYGTYWIGFDENSDKTYRHHCRYQLAINAKDKRLWSITIDKDHVSPLTDTPVSGFALFLFKLYAMKCTVEVDDSACELEWSTYND